MADRRRLISHYDAVGIAAGLPMFLVVGLVLDFGLNAGLQGWLFAVSVFGVTTNVTSHVLRRRGPDGDEYRRYAPLVPRAFLYSSILAVGAMLLGAGIGIGSPWLIAAGVMATVAGGTALTRLKRHQRQQFQAALDEKRSREHAA